MRESRVNGDADARGAKCGLAANVERHSKELAVADGCRNYLLALTTRDGRHEIQCDRYAVLREDACPTASNLSIDHNKVCDERLTRRLHTRLSEALSDRAAILESDEILVVIRQQVSDRRPLHFCSYRFAEPVLLTAFDVLVEILAGQLNRKLHIRSCQT